VNNNQPILIYLLTFLALSIILKLFGVISIESTELIGYALIFYGISLVYSSFGQNRMGVLFTGSSLFLVGFLLYLLSNFNFTDKKDIIFPSVLFILGINFLMLFFNEPIRKNFLAIAATLIFSSIIVTILHGSITFQSFFSTISEIIIKYWPVLLVAVALLIIIHRDGKKNL
jgi:hypothetical protein